MISVSVSVDTSRLDRLLHDMPAALARAQRKALIGIGSVVKNHSRDAIKNKATRPAHWPPRKKNYKHAPLLKSTVMWNSIEAKVTGPDTVTVGTPQEYAKYHQFGTKRMPARPFFPIDKAGRLLPDCLREINRKVETAYNDELRKIGIQ